MELGRPHAATVINQLSFSLGPVLALAALSHLLTSQAAPQRPASLEIQTAGESSSSVFSVSRVLFSTG